MIPPSFDYHAPQTLAEEPRPGRRIELKARKSRRSLYEDVAAVGPQRRRVRRRILLRVGVLELEADDEKADTAGESAHRAVLRRDRRAKEEGRVCARRARRCEQRQERRGDHETASHNVP